LGQAPLGVFSFNPVEGCRNVSEDVAQELRARCGLQRRESPKASGISSSRMMVTRRGSRTCAWPDARGIFLRLF
jgi:hypothetical protein